MDLWRAKLAAPHQYFEITPACYMKQIKTTNNNNKHVSGLTWSHSWNLHLKWCYILHHLTSNKWRAGSYGSKHSFEAEVHKRMPGCKKLGSKSLVPRPVELTNYSVCCGDCQKIYVKRLWEISWRRLMGKSQQEKVLQHHFMAEKKSHRWGITSQTSTFGRPESICWGANVHKRRHNNTTTPSLRNCWFDQRAPLVALI